MKWSLVYYNSQTKTHIDNVKCLYQKIRNISLKYVIFKNKLVQKGEITQNMQEEKIKTKNQLSETKRPQ